MSFLENLVTQFPDKIKILPHARGEHVLEVERHILPTVCAYLKNEHHPRFNFLMDLAGVDYSAFGAPTQVAAYTGANDPVSKPTAQDFSLNTHRERFAVVYNLFAWPEKLRLRLQVPVPELNPETPTVSHLWSGANWFEREVWDMFGIRFKGHPDLRRILLYDEFKGHPLRKDYPITRRHPLVDNQKAEAPFQAQNHHAAPFRIKIPEPGKQTQNMLLNIGPSHPAMHGVIHVFTELDGEKIQKADIGIGYLHRAFEKDAENVTWTQVFPYTDRLNYVSPLLNNVGYAMAVEKVMGLQTTERCQYIRVLMSEISRITDHLTCIAASTMEVGAMTAFLYFVKVRDMFYELIEEITGARLTVSYVRIGGVKADLTPEFPAHLQKVLVELRIAMKEMHALVTRNRIFVDRMKGLGVTDKETAIDYGFTGPFLRSTGIDYDVRKAEPYLVYDQLDFDIPYGQYGDNYDRYLVRMEEMEQSVRLIEQCMQKLQKMPGAPLNVDYEGKEIPASKMADLGKYGYTKGLLQIHALTDPTLSGGNAWLHDNIFPTDAKGVVLPAKEKTYGSIEGLMNHFMLIMEGYGIQPPPGDAYHAVEGANGELGFYVISDGKGQPYRVRVRPPCFALMSGFHKVIEGDMIADLIATFGTVNMIAGELDR
ncbi:MAG: NADH dehydrogenase (quinone) subunit D [candidate division KSB1 bacterium]|nr:NADH dehydrogenase (quinone) subunit D [candidate division KSB1 bacterium]MDZ7302989.1 NADH dehydrogenase (quinone) subunit D [candidate division KSB1 bacterium]MDZ7312265.1 NADH dehydrogenase (quinone) subunit D [candidate division KSB1 bacterium]